MGPAPGLAHRDGGCLPAVLDGGEVGSEPVAVPTGGNGEGDLMDIGLFVPIGDGNATPESMRRLGIGQG